MENILNLLAIYTSRKLQKYFQNITQVGVFSQLLASAMAQIAHVATQIATLSSVWWEQPTAQGINDENYFPLLPHPFFIWLKTFMIVTVSGSMDISIRAC